MMINTIKRTLRNKLELPSQMLRRHRVRDSLIPLTSHSDSKLRGIGIAIRESLVYRLPDKERQAIAPVEKRRSFLLKSNEAISVLDYGAGSPGSNRTVEEMENGILTTARVADIASVSKSAFWATILFKIIRQLHPQSCVELGSCVGISGSYQASAMQLNGSGKVVTLEGSPEIANIASETFELLGIDNASVVVGPFHETLNGVLETSSPVDFFFNDGHHDHDAVIKYFNKAMPYLSDGAVIVFDDISWSAGMQQAWSEIEDDERVSASIDLNKIGIAIVTNNGIEKQKFRIPL